jgi:xylulokinase
VVFVSTDEAAADPEGRLHAFCHAVPGRYHLMGVVLAAGGSLRWYRDTLAKVMTNEGDDAYEQIFARAAEAEPGAEGLYYLPYLAGERTPHMDPFARGAFAGLTLAHDDRHIARALIEGISFALKDSLDLIRKLGIEPDRLYAVGGGARSAIWRQWLAAILEMPLQRLEAEEGPAFGAALLAMVGAGLYGHVDDAVEAAVRRTDALERPDMALAERYQVIHQDFARLYPALKSSGIWHESGSGQ